MSVEAYPERDAIRFTELAELFLRCREAWRRVTIETQGHPTSGSAASRDQHDVANRIAPGRGNAHLLIAAVIQRYMLAASEQFGGLAALYGAQEVLYAPSAIARSLLEHCAGAAWVLGLNDDPADTRLARAYREELKSAEEAKKNAGRLLGKQHAQHQTMTEQFKRCTVEINEVFPGGWTTDGHGHRLLLGQELPGPEASVAWLLSRFLTRPHTVEVSQGTYGYISNLAHPTLYRISGMWAATERDGKRVAVLDVRVEDRNKMAQLIVSPYYELLARVIVYHGWPPGEHSKLTTAIDRLLPGMLK
jgi:hypothetical protein